MPPLPVGLPKGPAILLPFWSNTRMSGVNGLLGSKSPVPKPPCSLHILGRPCPDSSTYTWNCCELPRNAIPVGMFRPLAKTETLNPEGRTMFWPVPGSNKAVLSSQSGFATVAASAPVASARNDANATTVVRGYERLTRMRYIPPLVKTYAFSCLLSIGKRTSIMAAATPQLPPDHATALQHRRQSACKDADVILRGHSMAETVNEAHNLFPWFSHRR